MANSKRREEYTDRNGNMFIPMNVEGAQLNHFITTPKLILIVGMVLALFFLLTQLNGLRWTQYVIWLGTWFIVCLQLTRFVIFEEKFYYKMYKELQDHEISSPALFWDIASIDDTDDGAILTYSDAKIGIIVRLERDTITGKSYDFKETHYDAISDFYKSVTTNKYSFVQMNVMEQAGKDPRLVELGKLINKSDNANICKLMELQIGHIKNMTRSSLIESDYFLFYTPDLSRIDSIINDISDCVFKILDGAYIGYQVLTAREVVELVKDLYGVNYFNSTEASLMMFDKSIARNITPFVLTGLVWDTGEEQELTNEEKMKLRNITSSIIKETISSDDVALKEAVYRKEKKEKVGINFEDLGSVQQKSKFIQRKNKGTSGNRQAKQSEQNRKNVNSGVGQVSNNGTIGNGHMEQTGNKGTVENNKVVNNMVVGANINNTGNVDSASNANNAGGYLPDDTWQQEMYIDPNINDGGESILGDDEYIDF